LPKDSIIRAWFPHTIWATVIPVMLILGGTIIMATLVALIMWRANKDARKKKNVPGTRSNTTKGDAVRERQPRDVSSPMKRDKTKAS
jgi:hypothetical protein